MLIINGKSELSSTMRERELSSLIDWLISISRSMSSASEAKGLSETSESSTIRQKGPHHLIRLHFHVEPSYPTRILNQLEVQEEVFSDMPHLIFSRSFQIIDQH